MTGQWGEFTKQANEALQLLSSNRQAERISALQSLKIVLRNNANAVPAADDDKACHKIFEALFRFVSIEKPLFSRSKSIAQRSSASRLSECAGVMRVAVEVLLTNFRTKSLHALVDHIVQTLSDPNSELRALLRPDYIKCLKSILEYPPHVEHLGEEEWMEVAHFCLQCLNHTGTVGADLSIRTNQYSPSERSDSNIGNLSPSRSISNRPVRNSTHAVNELPLQDIVVCIQLLTSSPNSPIHNSAEKLLNGLAQFLSSFSSTEYAQQAAIKAINSIVSQVMFDQSALVKEFFLDVISVFRRLWNCKLSGLKDEILITIMLCIALLQDHNQISPGPLNIESIEELANVMLSEYIRRPERELLQIDDVIFHQTTASVADYQLIGPRLGNLKSEQNWTVLWTIARLFSFVDERNGQYHNSPVDSIPTKRPRLSRRTDDIFQDAVSSMGNTKASSLQLLVFLRYRISAETAKVLLDKLVGNIMDDSDFLASWAFLAIASIASTRESTTSSFRTVWLQAWSLASRASVIQGTSRAACLLMEEILRLRLLKPSDTAESIRAMLNTAELNGPSLLCDSSLMLWTKVLDTVYQLGSNYAVDAPRQICNWIRSLWTIGTLNDKVQVAHVATSARPAAILELLLACTGKTPTICQMPFRGITGVIANARMSMVQHTELVKYLFSRNETRNQSNDWNVQCTFLSLQPSSLKSDPSDGVVLNLLRAKIEDFSHAWTSLCGERSLHITSDYVQVMASICLVTAIFIECLPSPINPRATELFKSSGSLWRETCSYIATKEDNYIHAFLDVLAPIVWSISSERRLDDPISRALDKMAPSILEVLQERRRSLPGKSYNLEPETMELDNRILSQSNRTIGDSVISVNRRKFSTISDFVTLERGLTMQLAIYHYGNTFFDGRENHVHGPLIDYLKTLDTADILSSNWAWNGIFAACSKLPRDAVLEIIEHFGDICLQSYEVERCESSQCICIEMMTSFVSSWTGNEEDILAESASDLYGWFVRVLLQKRKASPNVLSALAALLAGVLDSNPSYSLASDGPSARTSLFHILQIGSLPVKFDVAQLIPAMFGRFLLRDHELIFEDILASLPTDPEWNEGIALRLYVLARLASTWHTLLRRSIYHIFETPGQLPQSSPYAKKCLDHITKALFLHDSREIFRLFAPQILYTWTESQSIMSMPFSIFGYQSLQEMMLDVQDEIIGQIMMRANDLDAATFSECVGSEFTAALEESFHKAEAYTIARDISIPPSQDSQPKGVESRLKRLLGGDRFLKVVETRFPETVTVLFKSLDHEEQIERAFGKRPHFQYASDILRQIVKRGASKATLPACQQPSFRARYLLDELEFLCKRAGYDLKTMWSPALVSAVCRGLLETIHPALGSLHACSVLRKLRILICIAGPIVLQDYPLEQAIHALCSFLTDFHCSDDALGLFWYLLEAGKDYLAERPNFVAGIAVMAFISFQKFFISSPESTTQESDFNAVITRLNEFKRWFANYLENYTSSNLSVDMQRSFHTMIAAAQKVSGVGNATKGTHESGLLLEILQDRSSQHSLLDHVVSDMALSRLSASFEQPPDLRNDILGDDTAAAENVMPLWRFIQNRESSRPFYLWAARVSGRAYAATGQISQDLLSKENSQVLQFSAVIQNADPALRSKITIIQKLCEMLYGSDRSHLGFIERTLQLIVSQLSTHPELSQCENALPLYLMKALIWSPYQCPNLPRLLPQTASNLTALKWKPDLSAPEWARDLAIALVNVSDRDPVIGPLGTVLYHIPGLAETVLPYIIHDVLLNETEGDQTCRRRLSDIFGEVLSSTHDATVPHARIVLNVILYLRYQQKPHESTVADRDDWLEIDYELAALTAANRCNMHKTALLFLEIQTSRALTGSRRSSVAQYSLPPHLLHDVFRNIGDPDMFYGVQSDATLNSVMEKLDYEGEGFKNLIFQSAHYDSDLRTTGHGSAQGIIKALNATNLQGVARAMCSASNDGDNNVSTDHLVSTVLSLQQWDIPVPVSSSSATGVLFKTFQNMNLMGNKQDLSFAIDQSFTSVMAHLTDQSRSLSSLKESMRALGILSEIDSILSCTSTEQLEEEWDKMVSRNAWFRTESFNDVSQILLSHETLFSSINFRDYLRSSLRIPSRTAQLFQVKAIRESLNLSRTHSDSQASLRSAMSLAKLIDPCGTFGLKIEAAAKFDLANVLWDLGEMTTSVRMLQEISHLSDLNKQTLPVSRAEVLASLGHYLAEARLEKPEAIVQDYLVPAVKELRGNSDGEESGRVFHRFAAFCDGQIQNQEDLEDFRRIEELRNRKEKEVIALDKMMEAAEGKEKATLKMHRTKAKQWFDLDDREYQRLRRSREALLQQCLENYLLALKACETHNSDSLRFCALWLDNSGDEKANTAVSKIIERVPSRKFASLMNQLSSRLLDTSDQFQTLLFSLILRICIEHPYHGMYQIFASSKSKGGRDPASLSRYQAAGKLVEKLKNDPSSGPTWIAIHNTNISYVRFAADKLDEKYKSGARVPLQTLPTGQRLEQDATIQKLPPPTMKIELRVDCNYSDVPKVVKFSSEFIVASGVSAPKIVTALATDGLRYKQLIKGGNDDLRQDAIMEQVFEQVSNLLKDNRTTQRRSLGIRTYRVLPLTSNAGIIEFVRNTIPLHDFLMPAHQRYYPKDMRPNACRKHISDVQTRSLEQRVRTFRQVIDHFHPVMRYFFMEKFHTPDDWFSRRLAYTRSTAAISILGHVLGLGDRHGHNILLDEKTGEVVHIDLGVAFEQGRVLPVPEVVPFRLTRDLVDGMGITKTEGVFRRCCEFTLEALRQESYSIMTILDVLRYDPLYSWTLSPLRMRRMQQDQQAEDAVSDIAASERKKTSNEASEADRALTVVAKKLSKTLSVTATVNELIQQATDERNLAVLYCGWAAYA